MLLWSIFLVSLGLASARNTRYVSPEHLAYLWSSGQDEEFARLMELDVSLVRPNAEQRSEGSRMNLVSPLGDILLSAEQERQGINFNKYPGSKWPNGRIPYTIGPGYTTQQRNVITNAIADFNKEVSKVQIVPRSLFQRDYVIVINGDGCYSNLGKVGGAQTLSLQSNGCLSNGTIQHEFVHAAGIQHEQCRADRDDFLEVLWENISPEWRSQYEKVNETDFPNILTYDYDSVMHYPIWSPSNRSLDAFKLPPGIDRNRLGQDIGVSQMDIARLNRMYT